MDASAKRSLLIHSYRRCWLGADRTFGHSCTSRNKLPHRLYIDSSCITAKLNRCRWSNRSYWQILWNGISEYDQQHSAFRHFLENRRQRDARYRQSWLVVDLHTKHVSSLAFGLSSLSISLVGQRISGVDALKWNGKLMGSMRTLMSEINIECSMWLCLVTFFSCLLLLKSQQNNNGPIDDDVVLERSISTLRAFTSISTRLIDKTVKRSLSHYIKYWQYLGSFQYFSSGYGV